MPALKNKRHERFAQELAKGRSATSAYKAAGYKGSRKNAARLATNEDIVARVAELQARAARRLEVTLAGKIAELQDAIDLAFDQQQPAAIGHLVKAQCVLAGIWRERHQVAVTQNVVRLPLPATSAEEWEREAQAENGSARSDQT